MNSMMQQLFMIPNFRQMIFQAKDLLSGELKEEDNVLFHTKLLFGNLLKSEQPVHNPIKFFESIKNYDGSVMPTHE